MFSFRKGLPEKDVVNVTLVRFVCDRDHFGSVELKND